MVKCPKCSTEIDHLEAIVSERTFYVVRLPVDEEEKKSVDYDPETGLVWVEDKIESPVDDSYTCPACRAELTTDEEEATKILKGE